MLHYRNFAGPIQSTFAEWALHNLKPRAIGAAGYDKHSELEADVNR